MKKCWMVAILAALLVAGCAEQPLETVSDIYPQAVEARAQQIELELPEEAAQPVMQREDGELLYLCDGYELRLQTLPSGNLTGALRTVTGFSDEDITVIQTMAGENTRYDCVWCTAGEEGELVGRTAILDDGSYYYCVSALSSAESAGQLQTVWQRLFSTFTLS